MTGKHRAPAADETPQEPAQESQQDEQASQAQESGYPVPPADKPYPGMQAAAYPWRTCREPTFNSQGMGYSCELVELHPGPCATFSVKQLVTNRERWEKANPGWQRRIGDSTTIV